MAKCLASSQTLTQFIRPSFLLSFTSKTDCVLKYLLSIESKGLNCNDGSFQVVVLLAIFLLQPMSNPTNKPSRNPICEPINDQTTNRTNQQLEQDALLPGNLSSKEVMFSDQEQDNEIQSDSTDPSNT
jgi:hypothetical protein